MLLRDELLMAERETVSKARSKAVRLTLNSTFVHRRFLPSPIRAAAARVRLRWSRRGSVVCSGSGRDWARVPGSGRSACSAAWRGRSASARVRSAARPQPRVEEPGPRGTEPRPPRSQPSPPGCAAPADGKDVIVSAHRPQCFSFTFLVTCSRFQQQGQAKTPEFKKFWGKISTKADFHLTSTFSRKAKVLDLTKCTLPPFQTVGHTAFFTSASRKRTQPKCNRSCIPFSTRFHSS